MVKPPTHSEIPISKKCLQSGKTIASIFYAFFNIIFLHFGQVTLTFPTPRGNLILVLHALHLKYLWVLRLFHASFLMLNHAINLLFSTRNFSFSAYLPEIFLEYILKHSHKSGTQETSPIIGERNALDIRVHAIDTISKNILSSSMP